MINKKHLQIALQISILMGISSTALAQDCEDMPTKPAMTDGATATMDQIVANSEEVKAYIAAADTYLDCHADYRQTIAYKSMSSEEKDASSDQAKALLDDRNDAGDEFNDEVQAYRDANPDA